MWNTCCVERIREVKRRLRRRWMMSVLLKEEREGQREETGFEANWRDVRTSIEIHEQTGKFQAKTFVLWERGNPKEYVSNFQSKTRVTRHLVVRKFHHSHFQECRSHHISLEVNISLIHITAIKWLFLQAVNPRIFTSLPHVRHVNFVKMFLKIKKIQLF